MMMPRLFGESIFDEMEQTFEKMFGWESPTLFMQEENQFATNVEEKDGKILLSMNLPGMEKKDIHAKLENGYLTISAAHKSENKKDEPGNPTERRYTQFSRSYYVGDQLKQEDIVAKFENGQLQLELPDLAKQIEQKEEDPFIKIEG